jgi:protein gp37
MREFFQENKAPDNFWLGVSVTRMDDLTLADELWRIPDVVVPWICAEPLREPIDISKYGIPECIENGAFDRDCHRCNLCDHYNGLGWVVTGLGQETRAGLHEVSWLRAIRDQCRSESVRFFLTSFGATASSAYVKRLRKEIGSWREVPKVFDPERMVAVG